VSPAIKSLGEAWVDLIDFTIRAGQLLDEAYEVLGVNVTFSAASTSDELIERFGDRRMIQEMRKVFFESSENGPGHSYAALLRGPGGRNDFADIIALLRDQPLSKRAVVTLRGEPHGKVPCINVVQFLVRDGHLETFYFARGQDAYKKFYADGLCLIQMAQKVAHGVELSVGLVRGFIGSSHVYCEDWPQAREMLTACRSAELSGRRGGA
jgi:thymidylate synthase